MRSALIVIIICLQLVPAIVHGQEKGMFIEQIAEKKIVRENFDKNEQLLSKQIFLIGVLSHDRETYKVDAVTELYNEKGQLIEKYTSTYQCNPKDFNVLLKVFPFSDPGNEKAKVYVTSEDFKEMDDLQSENYLKDIHVKMSVESGLLSFLALKA